MMSPRVEFAYYALWIAHPVLQLGVAGVMFRRNLHRKFPVFFSYALSQVLIFAVLFPISTKGTYFAFFYTYWITAAVSLTLGFKVIHEIFLDVFQPYHTLKDLGTVLFKWASLVMLLVAGVVAAASPTSDQGPLVQAVLTVQRCVRVIQCGLVLFLLLFARYLRVSWKQQSFGIALGFGTFAGVELFLVALHAASHTGETSSALVNMAAYNCAILIWLSYALAKSQAKESSANALVPQRWDQSLLDLHHPMPAESLIPMFEGMVDRAFSRSLGEPDEPGDSAPENSEAESQPPDDFASSILSSLDRPPKN